MDVFDYNIDAYYPIHLHIISLWAHSKTVLAGPIRFCTNCIYMGIDGSLIFVDFEITCIVMGDSIKSIVSCI